MRLRPWGARHRDQVLHEFQPDAASALIGADIHPFQLNRVAVFFAKGDASDGLVVDRRQQETAGWRAVDSGKAVKLRLQIREGRGRLRIRVLRIGRRPRIPAPAP